MIKTQSQGLPCVILFAGIPKGRGIYDPGEKTLTVVGFDLNVNGKTPYILQVEGERINIVATKPLSEDPQTGTKVYQVETK